MHHDKQVNAESLLGPRVCLVVSVYRLVTREPDRERQRASACCPSCRAPITTAPRPPPLVFLQHLETLRREAAPPSDTSASPARQQRDERVDRTTYQVPSGLGVRVRCWEGVGVLTVSRPACCTCVLSCRWRS